MRRMFVLFLVVVMMTSMFAMPAQATESVQPRVTAAAPELYISNGTATCSLMASADNSTDYLVATIGLYRGSVCVASWGATGYGYITFSQSRSVQSGFNYTMKVNLTVNGVSFPVGNVSRYY